MVATQTIRTISRHTIRSADSLPFSAALYSKFKYGSKDVARRFGKDLGNHVISKGVFEKITDREIMVIPSPYYFVPTATFALKDYFIATINPYITRELRMSPVQETKVWRKPAYVTDYGDMSQEDRKKAIGSESFYLDRELLKGKHVLFMDDIRITGAHEERMLEMIERLQLKDICSMDFLYYAVLGNSTADPRLEGYLNLFSMKSLLDLDKIIKNDSFLFNTRNIKFILASPPDECKNFLDYQSKTFVETLYHYALGNGYHMSEEFEVNFKTLEKSAT